MFIDSHCHLDLIDPDQNGENLPELLNSARDNHVDAMLCVSVSLQRFPAMLSLIEPYAHVYASVGVHPTQECEKEPEIAELVALADNPKIVAIGETGLDYFHCKGDMEWQHERFRRHIEASKITGKPLIIHTREAKSETIKLMQDENAQDAGGVMHCFVEDWETAKAAMDMGFYISFSGIVTFKSAKDLKEIAKKHNMFITFMPKPTIGDWRSGAHINFSMEDVNKPGKNIFTDGKSWSKESKYAVGGLMKYSEALTSITCSTVNSYNGLVPRVGGFEGGTVTWAPTNITYGHNNRSAQFRLPQNRYCIENRAADMMMNVYLALAMTVSAATEGIKNKIDPGKPTDQDLYQMTDAEFKKLGIRQLPKNLLQAIEALKKDKLSDEILGSVMKKSYLLYKNDEWEKFLGATTQWDLDTYLDCLP